MDISKIKTIVDTDYFSDDVKTSLILSVIAQDKNAIPTVMIMLNLEREQNKELILDSNAELSRALIVLNDKNLKSNKNIIADPKWVVGEIKKHYLKWAEKIKCNFKVEGLE